jgi:hypothetical protein
MKFDKTLTDFQAKSCRIQVTIISVNAAKHFSPLCSCKFKLIGSLGNEMVAVETGAIL